MERRLQLQPRLQLLADMTPAGCRLADIGTDHGYLPVWLLQRERIQSAIAADIGEMCIRDRPLLISPDRSCRAILRRKRCTAVSTDLGDRPTVSAISRQVRPSR